MDYKKLINPYVGTPGYNCYACSPDNPLGLHLTFFEDGEDILTRWTPTDTYSGWNNTLHGGIQALLIDEVCGWVVNRKLQTGGVTSKFEMHYKRPVETNGKPLEVRAHIREQRRNLITIDATLTDSEGRVCTEATSLFFTFPKEKAANELHFKPCLVEGETQTE